MPDKILTFQVYDFTLTAGGSLRLTAGGSYFRIMTSTGAVDVTVEGKGKLPGLLAGQALQDVDFDALVLTDASGSPNSGTILIASAEFKDNRLNGTVILGNVNGAFTNTNKTVTNASASLVAANANRRYMLIQNNDAAGDIYVTLDGTAATTAKGVKIAAGGSLEIQGYAPSGQVFAIGSVASNANIVVVEG